MLTQGADLDLTETGPWATRSRAVGPAAGRRAPPVTSPPTRSSPTGWPASMARRLQRLTARHGRRGPALQRPRPARPGRRQPDGSDRTRIAGGRSCSLSLDDAIAIGGESGGSVNDVVLAAIAHGFRTLLLHRGEEVERRFIRAFVPVSIHSTDTRQRFDNTVSSTFTELPVGVPEARRGPRSHHPPTRDPRGLRSDRRRRDPHPVVGIRPAAAARRSACGPRPEPWASSRACTRSPPTCPGLAGRCTCSAAA